jgi:hypothetical protein
VERGVLRLAEVPDLEFARHERTLDTVLTDPEASSSARGRGLRGAVALLALASAFYVLPGLVPGRVFLPMDLLSDLDAWKPDPAERRLVSNRLLSDVVLQFVPWNAAVRDRLARREAPWVNPLQGDGAPLFANPQVALLSPFTWLPLAFGDTGWVLAVFVKLLVAGLGARWAARELGASETAARFSGFVYLASAFSIVWAHYPLTNVTAVLPWLLASSLRLLRSQSARSTAAVVACAALATAGGHPETLFVGVLAIGAFLVWGVRGFEVASPRAPLRLLGAALAGFLMLAVQMVPFALLLGRSRVVHQRTLEGMGTVRLFAAAGLALPGLLGSPVGGEVDLTAAVAAGENFNVRSGAFVGALGTLCVLLVFRSLPRLSRCGLAVGAAALLISLNPPLLRDAVRLLPGVNLVAVPYWVVPFVLFTALASGAAVEAVANGPARRVAGGALLVAGALLAGASILVSMPAMRPALVRMARSGIERLRSEGKLPHGSSVYEERLQGYLERGRDTVLRRMALPGVFWALGGAALVSRSPRRKLLLMGAAAGELLSFGAFHLPSVARAEIPGEPPVVRALKQLDPGRKFLIAGTDAYPADLATLHGVRDIRSYDRLEGESFIERLEASEYDARNRSFPSALRPDSIARLARSGVRFFVARDPVPACPRVGGGPPPAAGLYELPAAVPMPLPANAAPPGLAAGSGLSALGALLAAGLVLSARHSPRYASRTRSFASSSRPVPERTTRPDSRTKPR